MNVVEKCSHVVFTTKNVQKIKEQMEKFSLILAVASSEAAAALRCIMTLHPCGYKAVLCSAK